MQDFRFLPMLCSTIDEIPEDSQLFAAEIKWDGWRAMCKIQQNPTLLSRTLKPIVSVDYIGQELSGIFPQDTVLDGEIIDGERIEHSWNRVQTICSSATPHQPLQDNPPLTYMVFDILMLQGKDVRSLPWRERRELLESHFENSESEIVKLNQVFLPNKQWLEDVLDKGHEGVVVKRTNSPYVGGRSGAWSKIKPQHAQSEEAIVTGLPLDGKGKYKGLVGGIEFRLPDGQTGRCSGFSDDIRQQISKNPQDFLGCVIEVSHWGRSKTGTLRHPQFKRIRLDREAKETLQNAPKTEKIRKAKSSASKPKMRNYKAMKDEKLLACFASLTQQSGDAYDRCLNGGSGNPNTDIECIKVLLKQRSLSTSG